MRVILFGATGMVGQGVLRQCLLAPDVEAILSVVRRAPAGASLQSGKLREIIVDDFYDLTAIQSELAGYDACFFSLGVSALGMKEAAYRRITYELTMVAAQAVLRANSALTFVYVSGAGTNVHGRAMWARVKGATEQALLAMSFQRAFMLRPGVIVPLDGIRSKTRLYRVIYTVLGPVLPLLLRRIPSAVTTTEQVGRVMLHLAREGYPR